MPAVAVGIAAAVDIAVVAADIAAVVVAGTAAVVVAGTDSDAKGNDGNGKFVPPSGFLYGSLYPPY